MAEVNSQLVKTLRDKTNAGMMDCKRALAEAGGDLEKAETILRKKGITKAEAKPPAPPRKASSRPISTCRARSVCSSR